MDKPVDKSGGLLTISVSVSLSAWCCSSSRRPAEHSRKSACWLPPFPPTVPRGARCHRDLLGLGCTARQWAVGVVHRNTSRLFEGLRMVARLADRSLACVFLGVGAPCRHRPCTMASSTAAHPMPPSQGVPITMVTRGSGLSLLTQAGFPARKQHPARCVQLLCATDCVSGPSLLAGPGLSLLAYPCGGLVLGVLRGDPAYSSQGALQCSRCQRASLTPRRGPVRRHACEPPGYGVHL